MATTAPSVESVGGLSLRRPWPRWAGLLALWTLFVWVGRLRNLVADPGGLAEANRWSLLGSVVFSVLGLAVAVGLAVAWRQGLPGRTTDILAVALAGLGIVVWAYRGLAILGRDYSAGFIVVHSVLALVTILLGVLVIRASPRRDNLMPWVNQ